MAELFISKADQEAAIALYGSLKLALSIESSKQETEDAHQIIAPYFARHRTKVEKALQKWQPIKTAPLDGSWFLAVMSGKHPETGLPFEPAIVRWNAGHWQEAGNPTTSGSWDLEWWYPIPEVPEEF